MHFLRQILTRGGSSLVISILAICSGALLCLQDPRPLQTLRNTLFDQYQQWQPRPYQEAPVRIIDIDEASLQQLGQWPWPRNRIADLVTRLQQAGAAAIVFDVLFAETDRTSPQAMLALWRPPENIRQALSHLPDHDQLLANALNRGHVILGFAADRIEETTSTPWLQTRYLTLGSPPQPWLHNFTRTTAALPLLQKSAVGQGAMVFIPDSDGVVRKVPLLVRRGDILLPSLSAEALRVAQNTPNVSVRTLAHTGLESLRIGFREIPVTAQGEIWVHYSKPVATRTLSAWKILAGETPLEQIQGKILLIGSSAQGLMDQRFTPLGGTIPGVEIHAQAIEQILSGHTLQRPGWASAAEALVMICCGLLTAILALKTRAAVASACFSTLLAGLWLVGWQAFSTYGLLIDSLSPSLALMLVFALCSLSRYRATEHRQRWVKQAFSRYVSPNLVEHLVAHPEHLELGGHRQSCSFVFTDLANFTHLMEGMDPTRAVALLNDYLDHMIAIAFAHQGTLDRIVGDAVAIMFSAPLPQLDHARRALTCALDMQRFASLYASTLQTQGIAFGQTRIGVHTGEVIVGNFGGNTMFDYRALGDPVNTASRLEGANKHLGTLICASAATLAECPGDPARPIGRLQLSGKTELVMSFEPLEPEASPDLSYQHAYDLMSSGNPDALAAFDKLATDRPDDPLVKPHLARLRKGETGDVIVIEGK